MVQATTGSGRGMLGHMPFSRPDLTVRQRLEAAGPVDAALAWQRYAEPALWPTWSPHLRRVDYAHERLRAGTPGRVFGPGGVWLNFWIEDVSEPDRSWTWLVRRGPVSMVLEHGVEATAGGSRTWLAIRGPAPLVVPYLPVARLALRRLVTVS